MFLQGFEGSEVGLLGTFMLKYSVTLNVSVSSVSIYFCFRSWLIFSPSSVVFFLRDFCILRVYGLFKLWFGYSFDLLTSFMYSDFTS